MFYLLSILWFIRTAKIFLFYFYLWQLKEYHLGRFRDHFRTAQGRRLIMNKLIFVKFLILLPLLFLLSARNEFFLFVLLAAILILYLIEVIFFVKNIFQKNFKKPVLTKKTVFLVPTGLIAELLIFLTVLVGAKDIFLFAFWLLLIDILSPLISSLVVFLFQIPAIIIRNQFILKKAKEKREEMKGLTVIGITGSYGKTSTKEFLYDILSEKFKVLKTSEHQNSEVGISQCILKKLKPEHEIFIAEMGAYGRGGIKLLADIAKPKIGILTGINDQHLALFKSQENIIKTKYELIESLPRDGLAIFNGDNEYCLELYKKTNIAKRLYRVQKTFLGMELKADIWAEDIRLKKEYILFKVFSREGETADFEVNILGVHNIPNILGAVAAAKRLGMSLGEISQACRKIKPEQGSMKILSGRYDPFIIDGSYSSNPDGAVADLEYLKIWPAKKFIIMPCLIELGRNSAKAHGKIGRKIAEVCDLAIITTQDRFKEIKEGAVAAGMPKENILFIEEPEKIVSQINIFSSPGDALLLEGRVSEKVIELLKS